MILQLLAAAFLGAWLLLDDPVPRLRSHASFWLLVCLVLAIPVLQLVPLPPDLWTRLPGREASEASLQLIGEASSWRPWSIAPNQTLASALAVIPPLVLMAMAASLGTKGARMAFGVITLAGLAAAALGCLQLASPNAEAYPYSATHVGWITGFHANRNAAADLFLIAILACAARFALSRAEGSRHDVAGRRKPGFRQFSNSLPAVFIIILLLSAATILTGSRAGIALLVPVLIVQLLILAPEIRHTRWRSAIFAGAASVIGGAFILSMIRYNTIAAGIAARFGGGGDGRFALWEDVRFAIDQFWPFGSGIGTFVTAYLPAESLEAVDPTMPNRAHNDYLELVLEAGVFGMTALALIAAVLLRLFWQARQERSVAFFSGGTLLILVFHSIVDYPLRNMALAGMAGVAAGLAIAYTRRDHAD